jgi:hypothetical protein
VRQFVTFVVAVALLAMPAAAIAGKPPGKPAGKPASKPAGKPASKPTVMFVVRGSVTAFAAASGSTNGSIAVTVSGGNRHATKLFANGSSQTFVVSSNTRVVSVGGLASGEKVLVKIRAAKDATASMVASIPAKQIVELG